ncbi:galactose oxidase [Chitinophaga niabensis]|uniref:galactose oxidase n=1 Tax=Chitinophaga niabensis TaxID=536979 RepID=UPI0031BA5D08
MRGLLAFIICLLTIQTKAQFSWKQATQLPVADGLAGAYAGVSNGALIIAGGTNFPGNKRPWDGGVKTWYDTIWVLEKENGKWKQAGRLPRPLGYGVALSSKKGLVCLGGGDARLNYADAFIISYKKGKVTITALPPMPGPAINACGVLINETIYMAGGIASPTGRATQHCWSLDLNAPAPQWKVLEPLPGQPRMLAMAGTEKGKFYVFGGVYLDSTLQRKYLKDSWVYQPGAGWKQIADLPGVLAAAPTPVYNNGRADLLLFGGDDGANAARVTELKDAHPGFNREVLRYNTVKDTWSVTGYIKAENVYAPVTTPLVIWNNKVVLPVGEARPAVRSRKILIGVQKQ